jgi:hypothetical protein
MSKNRSIPEVDLKQWMEERNSTKSDKVEILDVQKRGSKYEMSIKVSDPDEIRRLENTISQPLSRETAAKLVIPRRPQVETASTVFRPELVRDDLDLLSFDPLESKPQEIYEASIKLYYKKGIYGTVIDILTNFAAKGFENDTDDEAIKNFYDSWGFSTGFDELVEKLFFEFFRTGFVRTYKVVGRYVPQISPHMPLPNNPPERVNESKSSVFKNIADIYKKYDSVYQNSIIEIKKDRLELASLRSKEVCLYSKLSSDANTEVEKYLDSLPKEHAARKIRWSKEFIPVKYTILNPTRIEITGNMFFGQQLLELRPDKDLEDYLELPDSELTESERRFRRQLPSDFKKSAKDGDAIKLNPLLVGAIDYRRQPYERYPKPRGTRAFDTIAYKDALCKADLSTIDGINNYILKVTVGTDSHPVTDLQVLENVAELFNTPAKAFTVVWNHTLGIEKVTFPEISDILGKAKFEQANEDLTGALGVVRALIDGKSEGSTKALELAVKSVVEEVNYARRQVTRWIYNEYRDIADGMGFDKFPKVRFDDMALKDEVLMSSLIQGMIDRRIISYGEGIRKLGFDPDTIIAQMEAELPLVLSGKLGIIGSPFNPKAAPQLTQDTPDSDSAPTGDEPSPVDNTQPTQRTPRGTPSEGRPRRGFGPRRRRTASAFSEEVDSNTSSSGYFSKGVFVNKEVSSDLKTLDDDVVDISYVIFVDEQTSPKKFKESSFDKALERAEEEALKNFGSEVSLFKQIGTVGKSYFYKQSHVVKAEFSEDV